MNQFKDFAIDPLEWSTVYLSGISATIIWTALNYTWWTRYVARLLSSPGPAKARKLGYPNLLVHTAVSVAEVVIYYAKLWHLGRDPEPTMLDLVLCIVQSWTSLRLTSQSHRPPKRNLELTRANFHCMAFQRVLACGLGLYLGSPAWHKANLKLLDAFFWSRIIIFYSKTYFAGFQSFPNRYAAGMIGAHLLGMYAGDYPYGNAIYIGLMAVLLGFDGWAQHYDKYV
ncbi:hypothetical protein FALBO_8129 [Fusarium albosuccineum]|uniref:Uncharacterized protein n=1 Tax=Fusarium albosuccineum TaxID=1237068 RepID=A0A8H4PBU5_9HYPO|nr:hypothetical protein FALBO_8129 [Fusarium albosuccineum]